MSEEEEKQLELELIGEPALRRYPLTVACPECGAAVGDYCRAREGGYAAATHLARLRRAKYAE